VRVQNIHGPFELEECRGDLRAKELYAGMTVHLAKGSLALKTALVPGESYVAHANGDIRARFPAEASARYVLEAQGRLSTKLPQVDERAAGRVVGRSGEGDAYVELHAGGDLSLKVHDSSQSAETDASGQFDLDSISAQIEAEIAEHMGKIKLDQLAQQGFEQAMHRVEQQMLKFERKMERETQHAQERAQRAREKAEQAARRAQAKIARKSHHWNFALDMQGPFSRSGQRGQAPGASQEEQLAILKMLQEKKISTEQAEMLLKALES
jgi:hypothetical protein